MRTQLANIALVLLATWPLHTNSAASTFEGQAKYHICDLYGALRLYQIGTGRFPTTAEGWSVLVAPAANMKPVLSDLPRDPWDRIYTYHLEGDGPVVRSAGPDGVHGNSDDIVGRQAIGCEGLVGRGSGCSR